MLQNKVNKEEVYAMKRDGVKDSQIAKTLGVSRARIGQITAEASKDERAKWPKVQSTGGAYQLAKSVEIEDLITIARRVTNDPGIKRMERGAFPRLMAEALRAYNEKMEAVR